MNQRLTINQTINHTQKKIIDKNIIYTFLQRRAPRQLVIQLTTKCNAKCPQCGMRITQDFPRKSMEIDSVKTIIDHAARNRFTALSFTGGEPLIERESLIELIRYASNQNIPFIRTGTNGFVFKNSTGPQFKDKIKKLAEELAATGLYTFWISIDSADPAVHEQMRGLKGVIRGIEKALPIFHSYNIYPAANLGINRNTGGINDDLLKAATGEKHLHKSELYDIFKSSFEKFYNFVIDLGFTMTNACYPMSVESEQLNLNAVYSATSSDYIISFNEIEKTAIFKALYNTIPDFRSKIRIFTPRSSLLGLINEYEHTKKTNYACRGGIDFFYIDANDLMTYPCGYRGDESLGQFNKINFAKTNKKAYCTKCDWECFRDPSTVLGPLLNVPSLLGKSLFDQQFIKTWKQDLAYYKAANYFNGRLKPDWEKLKKFSSRVKKIPRETGY